MLMILLLTNYIIINIYNNNNYNIIDKSQRNIYGINKIIIYNFMINNNL